LDEVRSGFGHLDYRTFLKEMAVLEADVPLMVEHLSSENEYRQVVEYIRFVARSENLAI
jgi:hypothetical protein